MIFTRRSFLCGATAATLVIPSFMSLVTSEADAATDTILVVLNLGGGNDGFNTVIPIDQASHGNYLALRPALGITLPELEAAKTGFNSDIKVGSGQATQFAMHPSLGAVQNPDQPTPNATNNLRYLYGQGKVAVVTPVGTPQRAICRTDHTISSYYQATGQITGNPVPGFGARIADGNGQVFMSLISTSGQTGTVLKGGKTVPLACGDPSTYGFSVWGDSQGPVTDPNSAAHVQNLLTNIPEANLSAAWAQQQASEAADFISKVHTFGDAVTANDYRTNIYDPVNRSVGGSGLKSQFKSIARFILAGAPGRIYYAAAGGYDTHSHQLPTQASNLVHVSEGIAEFLAYLHQHGKGENVIVMTISDFGRTVHQNGNIGTDHGTGSVGFVVGDRVNGGVFGTYPSFAPDSLEGNSALVKIDFRSQIGAIVRSFGIDPLVVMPDYTPQNSDPGLYESSEAILANLLKKV